SDKNQPEKKDEKNDKESNEKKQDEKGDKNSDAKKQDEKETKTKKDASKKTINIVLFI
ncbi:MAG: hypothetical protein HOP31_05230, partial [Ignavibacteria bacterium]|nr:hypothetical protein [Ignavibacteria bacterium]